MPRLRNLSVTASALLLPLLLGCLAAAPRRACADYSETILHTFLAANGDGEDPDDTLVRASDGTFYGTTEEGGTAGDGTVFKVATNGALTILHSFGDGSVTSDGSYPIDRLTIGSDGLLYGTTLTGGANDEGTVFKMTTGGSETILHSFSGGTDGADPYGGITFGSDGKAYGTTNNSDSGSTAEYGTIYSVSTSGSNYLVQFRFNSSNYDTYGAEPYCTLTVVPGTTTNQFYGTCPYNGAGSNGTLFKFTPGNSDGGGSLTVLHAFDDGSVTNDGESPANGRLVFDSSNNIYGTTEYGGADDDGTAFEMTPAGKETILHSFGSITNDGSEPLEGLMLASDGNFYGSTDVGGANGDGTVFQLSPTGSIYNVVYNFAGADGQDPAGKPLEDSDGNLVGTTYTGGAYGGNSQYGVVYKLAAGLPNPVKLSSLTISPATVTGGAANATGTIKLAEPAPSAGAVVSLHSANSSVVSVPSSVTVAANAETATFTVTSHAVTSNYSVDITATYNGSTETGDITVTPAPSGPTVREVLVSPTSTQGGGTPTTANRVYLTSAPTANVSVALTSSNTAVATVPSTVTIDSGSTSHTFTITTKAVTSTQTVTITAKYNGSTQTATLTVTPPPSGLKSVTLSPTSTEGGTSTTANRVYWTGNAPANETVTLKSSNTAVATVPSTVTIDSGSSSHTFTITTKAVTSQQTVTITATSGGVTQTATLTVTP